MRLAARPYVNMPIFEIHSKRIYLSPIPHVADDALMGEILEIVSEYAEQSALMPSENLQAHFPQFTVPLTQEKLRSLFPLGYFDAEYAFIRDPYERAIDAYEDYISQITDDEDKPSIVRFLSQKFAHEAASYAPNALNAQSFYLNKSTKLFKIEDGFEAFFDELGITLEAEKLKRLKDYQKLLREKRAYQAVFAHDRSDIEAFLRKDYERLPYEPETPLAQMPAITTALEDRLFVVQTPCPRPKGSSSWGDWHFGTGLVNALRRMGIDADIRTKRDWYKRKAQHEVDIVLRGREPFNPELSELCAYWVISHPNGVSQSEFENMNWLFAAGDKMVERFDGVMDGQISLLPQAFDKDRMHPYADKKTDSAIFVGMNRQPFGRVIVDWAIDSQTDFHLYGTSWEGTRAEGFLQNPKTIANDKLGEAYSRHKIVLNDHTTQMRKTGLLSNRVYDALACGSAVITDPISWLPEDFLPYVDIVHNADELKEAAQRIFAETEKDQKNRDEFALSLIETDSFDARAREIVQTLKML